MLVFIIVHYFYRFKWAGIKWLLAKAFEIKFVINSLRYKRHIPKYSEIENFNWFCIIHNIPQQDNMEITGRFYPTHLTSCHLKKDRSPPHTPLATFFRTAETEQDLFYLPGNLCVVSLIQPLCHVDCLLCNIYAMLIVYYTTFKPCWLFYV